MLAISQSELPKYNCTSLICSKVQQPEMLLNYACINKTLHTKREKNNRNGLKSIWARNLLTVSRNYLLHFLLHSLPDASTRNYEANKYYTLIYHHNLSTKILRPKPHVFLHILFQNN